MRPEERAWDGQRRSRARSSQGTEGRGLEPNLPPMSVRVAGGAASRLSRRFMPRPLFRVCRGPSPRSSLRVSVYSPARVTRNRVPSQQPHLT